MTKFRYKGSGFTFVVLPGGRPGEVLQRIRAEQANVDKPPPGLLASQVRVAQALEDLRSTDLDPIVKRALVDVFTEIIAVTHQLEES